MISYKTENEIGLMKAGGAILHQVFEEIRPLLKPGIKTEEIDKRAEQLIIKHGAEPAFKRVKNYYWTTCICINEQIVHTPPSGTILQDGDVITVDMGVFYRGFNTDKADTVVVGGSSDNAIEGFLSAGRDTLQQAIGKAVGGNYIGTISRAIEEGIQKGGYYVIPDLTGHGVGRILHEDPMIPGFLSGRVEKTPPIKPGMVLAIEVIYAQKESPMVPEKRSDWSLVTATGVLSACFEETIAVLPKKTIVIT